jgi:4-amino-4-deoxy-L-arabinose transferase-like glycosyltransferase
MSPEEAKLLRRAAILVVLLVGLRLVLAAAMPLAADEAYYWLWSKHLAGGYYDHPPAIAWLIRLGTMIAGDREIGVRLVPVLAALPMSWAVYRAADLLFASRRIAARAAVYLNLTLLVAAGTVIVTPDAPLLVASAFLLYVLAQVLASGRGAWWVAVGAAAGAALLSKYTALFFGAGIVLWLALVPELRRWFRSPWLYVGGLVALALFSPVIVWNAGHGWVSFIKQFGRARADGFTLRYLAELVPVQIGLATPPVFLLGCAGAFAMLRGRGGARPARVLLGAMIWPIVLYFLWHSLHDRVEGNWLAPVYPAFAVAAALAAEELPWQGAMARLVVFSRRWAEPTGVILFVAVAVQAATGIVPLRRDPTARLLAVGWRELAQDIAAHRLALDARCVVATNYGLTAWLSFYLPRGTPVVQMNERIRWVNMPEPDPALFSGRVLYVGDPNIDPTPELRTRYATVEPEGQVIRSRNGQSIEAYRIDLLSGLKADPLDRLPPPELRP